MNTPAHLLTGAALFGRKGGKAPLFAATFGGLLPDLSLYIMVFWALYIEGASPSVVFRERYFSDEWQQVFAIDNSIPIWLCLLALAIWSKREWAIALCTSSLLHVGLDFFMHAGDGRPNFWPFSHWIFHSPVSYWNTYYHARWLAPVNFLASLVSFVVLWRMCRWKGRAFFGLLITAEFFAIWRMFAFF